MLENYSLSPKRILLLIAVLVFSSLMVTMSVNAVTTGNGTLVYQPTSNSFDGAGATYTRVICLKNSGSSYNGQLLCTYDQLKNVTVTVNGSSVSKQVYPIYRSTDNGSNWSLVTNVYDTTYGLDRTSQPFLYEVPQTVGSLTAGTILLAGNIFDSAKTVSRIVIWKSTDHGATWSFLSQVDSGGGCTYDPSATSTTTTVWEPFLGLDSSGNLMCYFSDERQKANGILQAVVERKSTDGGLTWGSLVNVTAISNKQYRPGMITVSKMGNGKYIATYEMVNLPSFTNNTAPVYCKFSDDGVTWTASDLGTQVKLGNGRGLGSSPFVKWVSAGGPNGMVIIASKWGLDSNNAISGAQDFYVNYNYGKGNWERLPMAVTCDGTDSSAYFAGFAQSFDTSVDGYTMYHSSNVENASNTITLSGTTYKMNDVRVGTRPLNAYRFEAENATLTDCTANSVIDASGGKEVQYINYSDSAVNFANVNVPTAGTYIINVRYSNGTGATSSHSVSVNGGTASTLSYPATADWNRYGWVTMSKTLNAGINTIKFSYISTQTEIDCIEVYQASTASKDHFRLVNRNSSKYLEVLNASTLDGAAVDQRSNTGYSCQGWLFIANGSYFYILNENSGKYLEIAGNSSTDGAVADQYSSTGYNCQQWSITPTDSGYCYIINRNSGKYLEIKGNSTADGAIADQYSSTSYNCQQWTLVKEGAE